MIRPMSTVTSTAPGAVRAHETCADVRTMYGRFAFINLALIRWRTVRQRHAVKPRTHTAYQLRVPLPYRPCAPRAAPRVGHLSPS